MWTIQKGEREREVTRDIAVYDYGREHDMLHHVVKVVHNEGRDVCVLTTSRSMMSGVGHKPSYLDVVVFLYSTKNDK